METTRFAIEGMRCEGSAKGIVVTLREIPGVASANARHDPGELGYRVVG